MLLLPLPTPRCPAVVGPTIRVCSCLCLTAFEKSFSLCSLPFDECKTDTEVRSEGRSLDRNQKIVTCAPDPAAIVARLPDMTWTICSDDESLVTASASLLVQSFNSFPFCRQPSGDRCAAAGHDVDHPLQRRVSCHGVGAAARGRALHCLHLTRGRQVFVVDE